MVLGGGTGCFFISRRADKDNYYVMDTEDGVEELLHYIDIANAVIDKGIQIEGVKVKRNKQGYTKSVSFEIHNDLLKSQPLLKAISGVDIKEVDEYIVSISINRNSEDKIKLSDYYKGVRLGALNGIHNVPRGNKHIFIFDDKLDMPLEPISKRTYINVDITNLTNDTIAYNFYKYIPYEKIIDRPERRLSFILDRVKDPSRLKSLGISDNYIQAEINKNLKTLNKYFSRVKIELKYRGIETSLPSMVRLARSLKLDKSRLNLLSYYILYGVDDAKEIAYKLLNRIETELGMSFKFSAGMFSVLPRLRQR